MQIYSTQAAIGFSPPPSGVLLTAIVSGIGIHFNEPRSDRGQTNFNNDSILIRARLRRTLNGNRMQSAKRSISGSIRLYKRSVPIDSHISKACDSRKNIHIDIVGVLSMRGSTRGALPEGTVAVRDGVSKCGQLM